MNWLIPALGYVLLVGLLGVSSKVAFERIAWPELLIWTALAYVVLAAVLIALGSPVRLHRGETGAMILLSAVIPPVGLALFFVALKHGQVNRVVPVTSTYPVITAIAAAWLLSERLGWTGLVGLTFVVAGVILLGI